jgi:hypothetical protein
MENGSGFSHAGAQRREGVTASNRAIPDAMDQLTLICTLTVRVRLPLLASTVIV